MNRSGFFLLFALLIGINGCGKKPLPPVEPQPNGNAIEDAALSDNQRRIKALTESEELLESLAEQISLLSKSFIDPSLRRNGIVQTKLEYVGLEDFDLTKAVEADSFDELAVHLKWPLSNAATVALADQIWRPLTSQHFLEDCQIGTLAARFEGSDFVTDTKIEGRLRLSGDLPIGIKAYQTLTWTKSDDQWLISKWHQTKFDLIAAPQPLFEDVTQTAIPDEATRTKVQNSSHVDLILKNANIPGKHLKDSQFKYRHFNDWESAYQYPGVSIVDIDRDGFDDLFVTDRWQSGQLLRNQGDGTFKDITSDVGLNVESLAISSFFADFDNDGDSDVFVGGTLAPSQYFENVDGKFRRVESMTDELQHVKFVVSGSVVDINGDGLLDLYLNTYGIGTGDTIEWIEDSVRVKDQIKLRLKIERSHFFLDRAGAPNIVLMNQNGKLKRVEIDDTLAQWRNTYQSTWTDYDRDGDQDLYLCNDFSPDCFLRNDTQRGSQELKFVDVSEELVPGGTMGFGMGASWGDFNNDGLQDLYVSNMYSKAGNRIVGQFDGVDERVKVSARGNFLYENLGGKFKQVAGTDAADQQVSQVGWSFGGQFADFDNDGFLDLYVPSGFYTPPDEVRKEGDW